MSDPYQAQIKALIEKNGPMGVNALQKAIGIPLSTMQHYLTKQSYFKKNESRKWDIPENVAQIQTATAMSNYDTVIDAQLTGINAMFEMLTNQMKSTIALLAAQKPISDPVAGNISSLLIKVQEKVQLIPKLIRQHKSNIPEEYLDLLLSVDWLELTVRKGTIYVDEVVSTEISGIITGDLDKFSDEMLEELEKYQK